MRALAPPPRWPRAGVHPDLVSWREPVCAYRPGRNTPRVPPVHVAAPRVARCELGSATARAAPTHRRQEHDGGNRHWWRTGRPHDWGRRGEPMDEMRATNGSRGTRHVPRGDGGILPDVRLCSWEIGLRSPAELRDSRRRHRRIPHSRRRCPSIANYCRLSDSSTCLRALQARSGSSSRPRSAAARWCWL